MVVARDGERWLPRTLQALRTQSRPPDEVVGVDTASGDASGHLLRASLPQVVATSAGASFVDAVRAGLAARDATHLRPVPGGLLPPAPLPACAAAREWVWLLHDDSAPAPDALARLLAAVERAPSAAVVGCKQRDWHHPDRLLQTGLTTSRRGRPLTGVEPGEVDQGQTDDREDVLAVGTAGMLVARDVWDRVAASDPVLAGVGEEVDLCRRAWLSGHRVMVVPDAVVAHADATRREGRRTPVLRRGLRWSERRAAAHRRLVDAPAPLLPLTACAVLLGGVGRMLLRALVGEPRRAPGELSAVLAALLRPGAVARARRATARTRTLPRSALRPLLAPRREVVRFHRDRWQRRRSLPPAAAGELPATGGSRAAPVLLLAGLATVALLALHRLVGPGPVAGGALLPPPPRLAELWETAGSGWRAAGLGLPEPAHPFLAVLAVVSTPLTSPGAAVTALLLLALPLAGAGGWAAAGALTRSPWLRAYAALAWAAAPPLLGALDGGRLGAAVAHLAVPWAVLAVARALSTRTPRRAWAAGAAGGLALTVAVAGAPVVLPAALVVLAVVAGVAAVTAGAGRRLLPLLATVVPPLVTAGPWLAASLREPGLLVADPGRTVPVPEPGGWQLLLGLPGPLSPWPVLPATAGTVAATAATAVLAVAAVLALTRTGRRGVVVRVGWVLVLVGLVTALAASRLGGFAGPGTSLVVAGMLAAALPGADGLAGRARGSVSRRGLVAVLATLAVLAPSGALAAWTWNAMDGGGAVRRGAQPVLPVVAADAAASPDRARTLVLGSDPENSGDGGDAGAAVAATIARTATEQLGGPALAAEAGDAASAALTEAVALLASASPDARDALSDLGVGYVLLRSGASGPGASLTAEGLDAVPGLSRSGTVDAGIFWRVTPPGGEHPDAVDRPARVRVLDADGAPVAVLASGSVDVHDWVPAGDPGRTVVLAERADDGWRATLDGRPLQPVVHDGWAQGFRLPAAGGQLVVEHGAATRSPLLAGQAVVLALTALVALPLVPGSAAGRRRR